MCSCLALSKYSLADLYLPCFKDAPTARTSVGFKGKGLSCQAEAILHHVFHNEARGCPLVFAYSSCSNRSKALLRLHGVLAASKACCWLPRPCAAYATGKSGRRTAGAGSLSSKVAGVKWHALLQLCMMLCLSVSSSWHKRRGRELTTSEGFLMFRLCRRDKCFVRLKRIAS